MSVGYAFPLDLPTLALSRAGEEKYLKKRKNQEVRILQASNTDYSTIYTIIIRWNAFPCVHDDENIRDFHSSLTASPAKTAFILV